MLNGFEDSTPTPKKKPEQVNLPMPENANDWFHHNVLRGRREVFSITTTVTPEIAKLLLDANMENRSLSQRDVEKYRVDIEAGRWDMNGESIKISRDGFLNDGQHRCAAVVESGVSIRTLVTFGVDRDSRMTLDQGRQRTTSDYLRMEGAVPYANEVSGAARILWGIRHGLTNSVSPAHGGTKLAIRSEYWANEKDLNSAAAFVCVRGSVPGGKVPAVAALVLMRRKSPSADDFMDKFIKGHELAEKDPILVVRNRLLGPTITSAIQKTNLLVRAFDHWLNGRTPSRMAARTIKRRPK